MEQILEQIKIPVIAGIMFGAVAGIINHYSAKNAVEKLKAARNELNTDEAE